MWVTDIPVSGEMAHLSTGRKGSQCGEEQVEIPKPPKRRWKPAETSIFTCRASCVGVWANYYTVSMTFSPSCQIGHNYNGDHIGWKKNPPNQNE